MLVLITKKHGLLTVRSHVYFSQFVLFLAGSNVLFLREDLRLLLRELQQVTRFLVGLYNGHRVMFFFGWRSLQADVRQLVALPFIGRSLTFILGARG